MLFQRFHGFTFGLIKLYDKFENVIGGKITMYFKVNLKKLDAHSQTLSDRLINEFYQNNQVISGQQILKFTPVEQINIFVIYHLFENWKESVEKFKSPYFDYENIQVKDAYNRFINILSQNISIEKDLFKPILRKSIYETLYWIVAPEELINYQYINGKIGTTSKVKTFAKYVRINKILVEELVTILEKQPKEKFPQDELVWHFTKIFEANQIAIHDPAILLQDFSNHMDCDVTDLIPNPNAKINLTDVIPVHSSKTSASDESIIEIKSSTSPVPAQNKKPEEQKEIERNDKEKILPAAEQKKNGLEFEKHKESARKSNDTSEAKILNQNFTKTAQTLNEVLSPEDNTLYKKLARTKVPDIKAAIPLNKKFQFIRELFNGQNDEYNTAISEVQNSTSYNQAVKLLQDNYALKFNWKIENPSVEEFYDLVERRFM